MLYSYIPNSWTLCYCKKIWKYPSYHQSGIIDLWNHLFCLIVFIAKGISTVLKYFLVHNNTMFKYHFYSTGIVNKLLVYKWILICFTWLKYGSIILTDNYKTYSSEKMAHRASGRRLEGKKRRKKLFTEKELTLQLSTSELNLGTRFTGPNCILKESVSFVTFSQSLFSNICERSIKI